MNPEFEKIFNELNFEEKVLKKQRFDKDYFMIKENKKSSLKRNQLSYCKTALENFVKILRKAQKKRQDAWRVPEINFQIIQDFHE